MSYFSDKPHFLSILGVVLLGCTVPITLHLPIPGAVAGCITCPRLIACMADSARAGDRAIILPGSVGGAQLCWTFRYGHPLLTTLGGLRASAPHVRVEPLVPLALYLPNARERVCTGR